MRYRRADSGMRAQYNRLAVRGVRGDQGVPANQSVPGVQGVPGEQGQGGVQSWPGCSSAREQRSAVAVDTGLQGRCGLHPLRLFPAVQKLRHAAQVAYSCGHSQSSLQVI